MYVYNTMLQSDSEQNQTKIVLPPLRNKRYQSVSQILSIITESKHRYQQQLQKHQPSNLSFHLQYAQNDTRNNQSGEVLEEEYLARGGIITHDKEQEYLKKGTLKTNSTLQYINQSALLSEQPTHLPISINRKYRSIQPKEKYPFKRKQHRLLSRRQKTQKDVTARHKDRMKTQQRDKQRQKSDVNEQSLDHSIVHKQKVYTDAFKECVRDLKRGSKTNQRLQKTIKVLECFNPFFRKIQRVIGVCLLRMGSIRQKQADSILYQAGEVYTHFGIILLGEVKITGKNGLHKTCETGQTLLEEVLLFEQQNRHKKVPNTAERVRVMEQSWILQVQRGDMHKLQKELNRFGFKEGVREVRALIKRNHIVKNWLRNKFNIIQKH